VASNQNPAALGAAVTFTATVSPAAATGSVTFLDGTASIGTSALHAGTATLTVTTLPGGSHTITANYSGDSNYLGSTSAPLIQSIGTVTSSITVTTSNSVVPWGHGVAFQATILPSTASGTVTLFDGVLANCNTAPVQLGTATISHGTAQFSTSFTCTGVGACSAASSDCYKPSPPPHEVWVVYNGDASTTGSTSQNVEVTVTGTPTYTSGGVQYRTISNSNPPPGELASAFYSPASASGTFEFFYLTPAGSVPLQCGPPVSGFEGNAQAICFSAPNMFPGPGTYLIAVAFYPASSQYYYSDSYEGDIERLSVLQVTP
jgi:hypothetical protein